MSYHDDIKAYLTACPLAAHSAAKTDEFLKAGVVPFMTAAPRRYFVMKPQGKIASLGEPPFQLCKGTRMHLVPGIGWRDIKPGKTRTQEQESLAQTALREGIEELGLKLGNIARLIDVGPYDFASVTTGAGKRMWLFAAEMKSADDFLEIAVGTAARAWLSEREFAVVGREDHRYILADIDRKLEAIYSTR